MRRQAAGICALLLLATNCAPPPQRISMQADTHVLVADGVSLAHISVSGSPTERPSLRIREGPRRLHIEALTRSENSWQVLARAGVLPGPATVELEGLHVPPLTLHLTPSNSDREQDGTPDFLRLDAAEDRQAFRRWFTFLAESQYFRSPLPPDIVDCAALIRYAFREALRAHESPWADGLRLRLVPAIPAIAKYQYPYTPLGANLFRVRPGAFATGDLTSGAFAQFADAQTLLRWNSRFVSKDTRRALPGDMLFFRQSEQPMPFHTMIFLGASQVDGTAGPYLLYHTGPSGEIRRVRVADLERHPEPRWQPLPGNPNFLGVYRWNIL